MSEMRSKCCGAKTTLKKTYGGYGIQPLPELMEVNIQRICLKCHKPTDLEEIKEVKIELNKKEPTLQR